MLATYISQTLNLLGNPSGNLYTNATIINYINTARNQIAAESQCVRYLATSAPTSYASFTANIAGGIVTSVTVVSGGSGYVASPTITVTSSSYSTAATFMAVVSGGTVTSVTVVSGGTGYTVAPTLAAVGGGNEAGMVTVQGQEVYPFSLITFANVAGYSQVLAVKGVSIIWGNLRYTVQRKSFSMYQAQIRTWSNSYQDIPAIGCQYGQGVSGSFYLYPVANTGYTMEWDCICLPIALVTDATVEVIPYPWTDAVPFFASYLALSGTNRLADADRMWREYDKFVKRARAFSQPMVTVSPYGRG